MKKTYIRFTVVCIAMLALIISSVVVLTSCGNMSIGYGNYSFSKVHIDTHEKSCCIDVNKWYNNEGGGIEIHSEEYGAMFLSEGSYILIEDACPICDR